MINLSKEMHNLASDPEEKSDDDQPTLEEAAESLVEERGAGNVEVIETEDGATLVVGHTSS